MTDKPLKKHAGCGGKLTKLISAAGFQFKGTGWYVTDYARKAQPEGSESGKDTAKDTKTEAAKSTETSANGTKEKPAASSEKSEKPSKSTPVGKTKKS